MPARAFLLAFAATCALAPIVSFALSATSAASEEVIVAPAPAPPAPAPALVPDAAHAPPAEARAIPSDAADGKFDSDDALPAHADSVVAYELRASLDPERHTLHGEGSIRWTNKSSTPVREVWLHLYLNAFKNQRSTFLSEPIGGFRGSERVADWGSIDVRRFALRREAGA